MEQATTTLTIRLPRDLKNRLQMFCEQNDLTPSQVVRQLLKNDYRLQAMKPPAPVSQVKQTHNRPGSQQKKRGK